MSTSRSWEKSGGFKYSKLVCVLGLTYLFLVALQGFYPCVHLWPDVPSRKLAESPAPGGVLYGGG